MLPGEFLTCLFWFGRCGDLPPMREERAIAWAWWEDECGATFVQASAFPVAVLPVLLYGRSTSRGSVYLGHT